MHLLLVLLKKQQSPDTLFQFGGTSRSFCLALFERILYKYTYILYYYIQSSSGHYLSLDNRMTG